MMHKSLIIAVVCAMYILAITVSTTTATLSGIHLTKAKTALLRSQSVIRKFKPNAPSRIIVDGKLDNIPSMLDYDLFSDARGEEEGIIAFEATKSGGLKMTSFTDPFEYPNRLCVLNHSMPQDHKNHSKWVTES